MKATGITVIFLLLFFLSGFANYTLADDGELPYEENICHQSLNDERKNTPVVRGAEIKATFE